MPTSESTFGLYTRATYLTTTEKEQNSEFYMQSSNGDCITHKFVPLMFRPNLALHGVLHEQDGELGCYQ